MEPGEQRRDRPIGGFVAEPAAEQLPERLLDAVAALPLHEIRERPHASPSRETRPAEHIADVARDPEGGVAQVRHETGVGPEERAGRPRRDQRQTEIPAEGDPPGLPRRQRIGTGFQLEVADRHRRRDHAAVRVRSFEHHGLGTRSLEPERCGEPGDAAADDGDAGGHGAATPAR